MLQTGGCCFVFFFFVLILFSLIVLAAVAGKALQLSVVNSNFSSTFSSSGITVTTTPGTLSVNNTPNDTSVTTDLNFMTDNSSFSIAPVSVTPGKTKIILPPITTPVPSTADSLVYQASAQTIANKSIQDALMINPNAFGSSPTLIEGPNITPGSSLLLPFSYDVAGSFGATVDSSIDPLIPYWEMTIVFTQQFLLNASSVQLTPASPEAAQIGPYFVQAVTANEFIVRQLIVTAPVLPTFTSLFYYSVN